MKSDLSLKYVSFKRTFPFEISPSIIPELRFYNAFSSVFETISAKYEVRQVSNIIGGI